MLQSQLKEYVENNSNLVQMKRSEAYPDLFVLKYKRKVFYSGNWNRYLEKCRGLVVDKDFNIIVHPFDKIYNYGIEKNSPVLSDDEKVLVIKKYNGFMATASKYKDDVVVATTGSLDSDYAKLAREMILKAIPEKNFIHDTTFMFEICHSSDPHIIPEKEGVYFLGQRDNGYNDKISHSKSISVMLGSELTWTNYTEFDREYNMLGLTIPVPTYTTLGELKERVKKVKHEGYVAYAKDGESFKLKSPYYLINKLFARKQNIDSLLDGNLSKIDEEYYPLVEHIKENREVFSGMDEQSRLNFTRTFLENYLD